MSGSTTTDRFRRADAIFDAALDLPDREQTAFVQRVCADDATLRDDVLELLAANRGAGILDGSAAPMAALLVGNGESSEDDAPERVGAYRVLREIGRGGMGRVFLAERADAQFEQRVAVKLLQHASPGLVRRFVEERRILARLEHPGIARLIDGGVAANGLPYFALEYVEGEHIDRYCTDRDLALDARLALVTRVCDAVSYAHRHLVIHRDLKPSNILVTATGDVKLLDFGIAKLIVDEKTGDADAVDTRTELRAMTPEFAAPEQVRGAPVSTATDVYALGVLLYLLLTGERPYEVRGKSPAEIERIVCDFEPPSPSTRAPASLGRRLRGDLDLIVMTALQKVEGRRYPTPAALADDLGRFRAGRPILARPDTTAYRIRRFVGRHRAAVAAGAALVLALAGAASRERVLRTRAEVVLRKATEVERFLVGVFDVADPYAARPYSVQRVTADELLDRSARRIDSSLAGQPDVQAELRATLGRVYANLGHFDRATPLLRQSLAQHARVRGENDPAVAASLDLLGAALTQQDRYDEAEPLLRRALDLRRRSLGGRDTATAASLAHLAALLGKRNAYDSAVPLYREALGVYQSALGDTSVQVASVMGSLGLALYSQGKYDEAEPLQRRALDIVQRRLGDAHPLTAESMRSLALTLQLRRNFDDAERFFRQSLLVNRRALGDAHPSVAAGLNELSRFLTFNEPSAAQLDEAERLAREAIVLDRRIFGARHSSVAEGTRNLAIILRAKGDFTGAELALREALATDRVLLGEPHRKVSAILGDLAGVLFQTGRSDDAIPLMRASLAQSRAVAGDAHVNTLIAAQSLGRMLAAAGDGAEAERLLRSVMMAMDTTKHEHHLGSYEAQRALGEAVLSQGRVGDALPLLSDALAAVRARYGDDDWRTAESRLTYGRALLAARRVDEARPLLLAARATLDRERRAQPRLAAAASAAVARLDAR
ncbi:MAG: serine/threonine-protein kinase [Gemmatimonadota bacterium]